MVEWPVVEEESRLEELADKFEDLVEGHLKGLAQGDGLK